MRDTCFGLTAVAVLALSGSPAALAKPSFVVPDRIYAAAGHECNVYFGNVLDSATPWVYAYEALCDVGRHEVKRWCWTPKEADAGSSHRLVLRAVDDTGLVAAATTTVTVAALADKSKPVALATLSSSLVNCGYPRKVFEDMRKNGFAGFRAVGTRDGRKKAAGGVIPPADGIAPEDIPRHDGYGGWTFNCFLSRYQITETEFEKIQSAAERQQLENMGVKVPASMDRQRHRLRSPFVRIEDGKKVLDVQMWLDKVNGGKPPEVIVVTLGVNGTFAPRDEEALRKMVDGSQIPAAKKLLALLRKTCPRSVIGLGTTYVGGSQDGYAENYGCLQSAVQFRHNSFYITRRLIQLVAESGDLRLYVMPISQSIDAECGYFRREVPAHARTSRKVRRDTNALHLDDDGGWQVADAVTAFILGHWAEY
ncbi:MAG: hypothetical protein IJQ65_04580 [Kiritimatiellae bacterium]|nr:hypothetical protein [Kiritimatiellia bacterium]